MLSTIASATAQAARAVADAALAANARSSHSLFSSSGSGSGSGAAAPSAARPGAIASRSPVGSDSPNSDSAPTEHTPTSARISPHADEAELAKLPDDAKFYFKRGDHGHMEVTLRINNRPVPCWFDTGAAAYFGMDQLRSAGIDVSKAVPAGYARGWAGNPVPIWRMPAQVTLGNLTRTLDIDMQQGGGDSHIAALIGQDFVQGYQYEIDDKGGVVNLHKTFKTAAGQTEQKVDSLYDVPCTFSRGDDVIKMEINGRTCDAFIDTGASNTIIDARTARAAHIEITDDMERATMSGVGGNFSVVVAYVNLRVGPIRREGFRVLVGGTAGTCIGQDFMSGWRFKVDRQKGMMRFFH
jgi:predicted aspartyl protease